MAEPSARLLEEGPVAAEYRAAYGFWRGRTFAEHYRAYYEHERVDKSVNYGPESLAHEARYQVVLAALRELPDGSRVLDWGCAHGPYTNNLARALPALTFVGVDIVQDNVDRATAWAARDGLTNATFRHQPGSEPDSAAALGEFDCIIAAEVLEHVAHPARTVDALARLLKSNGRMLLTTPYGPWEWRGFYKDWPWRSHVHHLEPDDLRALFGAHPGFLLRVIPNGGTEGGAYVIGNIVTTFGRPTEPSGKIDWPAKLARQVPAETLTVCMICRRDTTTLGRTLESVRGIAHQIVVGVDCGPRGDLPLEGSRAAVTAGQFLGETFGLVSPLKQGFDSARNETLTRARGDWVLWIDDDEVLEWPERLLSFTRRSPFAGLMVAQHHYSAEPAAMIKTDYPCRVFRNHMGIRFRGVVHEHPELSPVEGKPREPVGPVFMIPQNVVAICHNGYETEIVRRQRYERNVPLMARDVEANPDRSLTQFLYLRDLGHSNRFEFENTGSPFSPTIQRRAETMLALWRGLLRGCEKDPGLLRLVLDAVPYVNAATERLMGARALVFDLALAAGRYGGQLGDAMNGTPPLVTRVKVPTVADARALADAMLKEKLTPLEGRYL